MFGRINSSVDFGANNVQYLILSLSLTALISHLSVTDLNSNFYREWVCSGPVDDVLGQGAQWLIYLIMKRMEFIP